jgi:hypothetical protein
MAGQNMMQIFTAKDLRFLKDKHIPKLDKFKKKYLKKANKM